MRKITRIGDLINLSNKKKYISFDLFDTLIRRRFIQANEVHDTVSAYVLAQIGHRRNRSPFEMTLLRYRVTDSLKSSSERSIQEPALNLIWDRVLLRDLPLPAERAAVVERTVSFEFAIEMANLALVEGVRDLLVRLKAQGKILVAATDMYFDAKRMRELLEKLEILDLFDHLYVSADVNLTKQTGALFERILSDLGISAASMLHVGDNLHSDIAMARKIGIMPVLVEQPDLLALERPAYGKRGHIEEEIADLTKMHLLSLLFDAQDRRVDHIYFMGRDGCAISQFFGEWESPIVGRFLPSPGHSDIFLNRALTCWGGIDFSGRWLAQAIDLTFWLNHGKATAREISDILGIEDVPAALGTAELHSASDTERAAQGYRDAGLADCIKASLLSKQRRLYRHLTDIGFFSYKSVAFSDVGYSGSALRDLNALFLAHSTDEDPVPPEMVLHLIATNDNYDANARRAFPFVDFSSQTIVPTALLPSELKQSFAWLEFFFKHPTLKPVLRFKETEAGLHPDLIHEAAPDKAMPGDRVREFGWARDADVALLWMAAIDFKEQFVGPIIDRFAHPDEATINQMRDEVFELHSLRGARRSIILEMPQASPLAVASAAREGDYWIPGSIAASAAKTSLGSVAAHPTGMAPPVVLANAKAASPPRVMRWLRRAVHVKREGPIPQTPGFDPRFYGTYYNDLRQFRTDEALLSHYWNYGRHEQRLISREALLVHLQAECGPIPKDYDSSTYLSLNPDLATSCDTPEQALNHYMRTGRHEGRRYLLINHDVAEQFDALRAKGLLHLTEQELVRWQSGEPIITLYLHRHDISGVRWIDDIDVAEFRALHSSWCGPVTTKAECIVALLENGLERQPSLSLRVPFDDEYYRSQTPALASLSAEGVYRHYLNVGSTRNSAPSEQVALLRLWGQAVFPTCFDWNGYQSKAQPHLRDASRTTVLASFLDAPGRDRLAFVKGPDRASLIEVMATRAWRLDGRTADARELYEAALEAGGNAGQLHHLLGDLLREMGNNRHALHHFRQGLTTSSPNRWSYINAAQLHIEQGDFSSALAVLSAGQSAWQEMAPWRRMVDRALDGACNSWIESSVFGAADFPDLDELDVLYDQVTRSLPRAEAVGAGGSGVLIVTSRPVAPADRSKALAKDITVFSSSDATSSDLLSALLVHKLAIFHEVPLNLTVLRAIGMAKSLGVPTIAWLGDLVAWDGHKLDEVVWGERGDQQSILRFSNLWEVALSARYCSEAVMTLGGCRSYVEAIAANCVVHEIAPPPAYGRGLHKKRVVLVLPNDNPSPSQLATLASGLEQAGAQDENLFFVVDATVAARPELRRLLGRRSLIDGDIPLPDFARLMGTVDAVLQFEPEPLRPYEAWRGALAFGVPALVIGRDVDPTESRSTLPLATSDLCGDIVRIATSEPNPIPGVAATALSAPAIPDGAHKPRILFANIFFAPQVIGGATRVLKDNVDYLLDHHSDEFEFAVFTADEQNAEAGEWRLDSYRDIPVFRVATPQEINMDWRMSNAMVRARFGAVIDAFKPDLVHIHCLQRLSVTVADVCRIRDIPYIVTLHDAWWISDFSFLTDDRGVGARALPDYYDQPRLADVNIDKSVNRAAFLRSTLMSAARRLAVSHSFADVYAACGIPCEVVENGTSRITPVLRKAARERVHLCHIGGLQHHKGAYLVEAALRNNQYDNLHYTVVDLARGPSEVTHTVWGTTPVAIIGKMTSEELARFYARMNVLLAPSTWPESYGLVSREALAHGLWVVAGDLGAMGDPVEDGRNGFIVTVSDAIGVAETLREIDHSFERYRVSPQVISNERSVDEQSRELVRIYCDMVGRQGIRQAAKPVSACTS